MAFDRYFQASVHDCLSKLVHHFVLHKHMLSEVEEVKYGKMEPW